MKPRATAIVPFLVKSSSLMVAVNYSRRSFPNLTRGFFRASHLRSRDRRQFPIEGKMMYCPGPRLDAQNDLAAARRRGCRDPIDPERADCELAKSGHDLVPHVLGQVGQ